MTDAAGPLPADRLDRVLSIVAWALAIATLVFAAFFAYSVVQARQIENTTSPARRAILTVEQAVKQSPNDPAVRIRLAEVLYAAGQQSKAVDQLGVALKLDEKNAVAYLDLGVIALADRRYDVAKKQFEKVIELTDRYEYAAINDKREKAFFYLGEVGLETGKFEDSVANYKAALRIRRDASDTYLGLAKAFLGLEEEDAALEQFRYALRFDPSYPEANYEVGKIYEKRGDLVQASWHYRVAVDASRGGSQVPVEALENIGTFDAWLGKAKAALKAGKLDEAEDAAKISRAIEPRSIDGAVLHGQILERKGDKKTALSTYKQAAKIDAANKDVAAAVKRLSRAGKE